jgi:hypothetical protein
MTNFFKKIGEILTLDIRQAIFKREQQVPVLTQAVEPTEVTQASAAPYKVEAPVAETAGTPVLDKPKARKPRKSKKKSAS